MINIPRHLVMINIPTHLVSLSSLQTPADPQADKILSLLIVLIHIQIPDSVHVNRLRGSDLSCNKTREKEGALWLGKSHHSS